MMGCQRCNSERVADVMAKCNDLCDVVIGDIEHDGYVPNIGVGEGDCVELSFCLDCGQLQGTWPLPETDLERQNQQ